MVEANLADKDKFGKNLGREMAALISGVISAVVILMIIGGAVAKSSFF